MYVTSSIIFLKIKFYYDSSNYLPAPFCLKDPNYLPWFTKSLFICSDTFSVSSPDTHKHSNSSYIKIFSISCIIKTIYSSVAYFPYANFLDKFLKTPLYKSIFSFVKWTSFVGRKLNVSKNANLLLLLLLFYYCDGKIYIYISSLCIRKSF